MQLCRAHQGSATCLSAWVLLTAPAAREGLGGIPFAVSTGRTPLLHLHLQGPAEDPSVAAQVLYSSLCPEAGMPLRQDHKFFSGPENDLLWSSEGSMQGLRTTY